MIVNVVIPAFNEEDAITSVLEELRNLEGREIEIIVVDDGSTDSTAEIASSSGARVISLEKNSGKVRALQTGIDAANADVIVVMDADFTYPAEGIPRMVNLIEAGADMVIGSRFLGGISNMPPLNRFGNRLFSLAGSFVSGLKITDSQSGLRAFKKDLIKDLDFRATGLEFETEMSVKIAKLGYRVEEVPIEYRKRLGKSKLRPLNDGFGMARGILGVIWRESSPTAKAIMFPSLVLFAIGLYLAGVVLWDYLRIGLVTHEYIPLLTVLLWLVSLQFFSIAILIDNISAKLERQAERFERTLKNMN